MKILGTHTQTIFAVSVSYQLRFNRSICKYNAKAKTFLSLFSVLDFADSQLYLWVAIGLLAVAFLVSSVIGIYCTKRFRNNSGLDPAEIDAFTNGGDPSLNGDDAFLRPYKLEFEIPRNDITLGDWGILILVVTLIEFNCY